MLQVYLKTNIIKIPGNVALPEDAASNEKQYTAEDEVALDKEIEELQITITNVSWFVSKRVTQNTPFGHVRARLFKQVHFFQAKYMKSRLEQELSDNAEIANEMEDLLRHLSKVEDSFVETGSTYRKSLFHVNPTAVLSKSVSTYLLHSTLGRHRPKSPDLATITNFTFARRLIAAPAEALRIRCV